MFWGSWIPWGQYLSRNFNLNSDSTKLLTAKEKKEISKLEAELERIEKAKKVK